VAQIAKLDRQANLIQHELIQRTFQEMGLTDLPNLLDSLFGLVIAARSSI
jgi:hypothetical protein